MFISYKDFENKAYKLIKLINKVINIDIINYTRKLKRSSFKINFNNILKINELEIIIKLTRKIERYSLSILFLFE